MSFAAFLPMIMQMMQGGQPQQAPQMQGMPQQQGFDPNQLPPMTGQEAPDFGQQISQLDQEKQKQAQMMAGMMRR